MNQQHTPCPLCGVTPGARRLLGLIVEYMQAERQVPSHAELAALLTVDKRTVTRWIGQLRNASILTTTPRYRGANLVINEITSAGDLKDHQITRSTHLVINEITSAGDRQDHQIRASGDRQDHQIDARPVIPPVLTPSAESGDRRRSPDAPGGGGGVHDHASESPPSPPRRRSVAQPCETRLGRYLAAQGVGAAREFDRAELNADQWIAWFEAARREGWPLQRIVHLMRAGAPLEYKPPSWAAPTSWAAPAAGDAQAAGAEFAGDDQADDQAAGELAAPAPAIDVAQQRWERLQGGKR